MLTDRGLEVACNIQRRHKTLSRFFSLFGLSKDVQRKDIEGIEHHLSPDTVTLLADLVNFFEKKPKMLEKFLNDREQPSDDPKA